MEKPLFSWARQWSATRDKLRTSLTTRVGRLWPSYQITASPALRKSSRMRSFLTFLIQKSHLSMENDSLYSNEKWGWENEQPVLIFL